MNRVIVVTNSAGEFLCMPPYLFNNTTKVILYPSYKNNESLFADVTLRCDTNDSNSCVEAFDSIYDRFGKIDVFLNYITKCERTDRGLDFNLNWMYNVLHSGTRIINKQNFGTVINIFSQDFLRMDPISRAGVLGFVRRFKQGVPKHMVIENIELDDISLYDIRKEITCLVEQTNIAEVAERLCVRLQSVINAGSNPALSSI